MKVLVFPRDANPYQELLYSEMRKLGVRIIYLGGLTPFHGLNISLVPLEAVVRCLFGADLVHIHWVAPFVLPGGRRYSFVRRISQAWFCLWLRLTTRLGIRLVWTAHNILPHEPVFADDIAARRALVAASDLVIVHSDETREGLVGIGATPRRIAVIPHGPFDAAGPVRTPDVDGVVDAFSPFKFLFIGRVKAYKGVEELLSAFTGLGPALKVHLTIAGQCSEPELLHRLSRFADDPRISMQVGPERLSDEAMSAYLSDAHVVVFPFKVITTSGSAILAISHGKPVIVPSTARMIDIPEPAAVRYDGTREGLMSALERAARMSAIELDAMSGAAFKHAHRISWKDIAMQTKAMMSDL